MTRVRRGYIARKRRKKMRLFVSTFRGAHSRLTRTIAQHKIRALVSAHRDRDRQKRDFRRLWITRINTVIRENGVYYNYSKFIHDLHKRQLLLNRKILWLEILYFVNPIALLILEKYLYQYTVSSTHSSPYRKWII